MNIWQNKRTLAELGILAGITSSVMAIRQYRIKRVDNTIFNKYPKLNNSQFVIPFARLHALEQPLEFELLLQTTEQFLIYVSDTYEGEQFLANRHGESIRKRCHQMLDHAKRDHSTNIVDTAINIEQDELEIIENLVENFLRNMLLG